MAKGTKRLGRGLDALVTNLVAPSQVDRRVVAEESIPSTSNTRPPDDEQKSSPFSSLVPVDDIQPNPLQPRRNINNIDVSSLADSIRRSGILQPIVVRRSAGRLEIIAGERRWTAAKLAGLDMIPVIERKATDEQMLELALIENIQREDLNAIDRAVAYRSFCDRFGLTAVEVGQRVGEDRTTVTNYLRLLDLPPEIQDQVAAGELSMGHARCLLGVTDRARRTQLASAVIENNLSVRAVEEIVRREKKGSPGEQVPVTRHSIRDPHLSDIEQKFERALKTRVRIKEGRRKGFGKITIEYYSLEDFDRVAEICGVEFDD